MLGLTKTRRQADMRKSGPSGKRRARFFAAHRYRKSGPRKTALTGLRKKKNDCRYIDDAGACTSRRRPAEEVCHPSKESGGGHGKDTERARRKHGKGKERARRRHGESKERARESKERARKGQGGSTERARREHREGMERPQKTGRGSKEGQERLKRAGWRGKEPAGRGGEEPAGGGKCRLRCMNTKKPAPSSGAGTLLGRSQIRASHHCQPSHARGWRTHA